jgi:hypothetical protein
MAAKSKVPKGPKNQYMCTHGQDSCLLWEWEDDHNWWTKFVGFCDCSECHGFLDEGKHAVTLAKALKEAKEG